MRLAIEEAAKSVNENSRVDVPRVGVVVVSAGGELVGASHRGATGPGEHAEFGLFRRLAEQSLDARGSIVYSTLEPCSRRGPGKTPCAQRLIDAGVAEVVIGSYDPNPVIYREGWRMLRDVGVVLRDFDDEHRNQVLALNATFNEQFRQGVGPRGRATFDYLQNRGRFNVYVDESRASVVETRWSGRGRDSIYANGGHPGIVAHARFAGQFDEIDDPGSFDFSGHSVGIAVGEIAVFRTSSAFVLVRVEEVHSGPDYGADHTSVTIEYEVRASDQLRP